MGREIKRVPVGFDHPLKKVWPGYLMPDTFDEDKCPDCKSGYAPLAQGLYDLWYGYLPFDPTSTGSTMLRYDTPAVRAFAERNLASAPDCYGTGNAALRREGRCVGRAARAPVPRRRAGRGRHGAERVDAGVPRDAGARCTPDRDRRRGWWRRVNDAHRLNPEDA